MPPKKPKFDKAPDINKDKNAIAARDAPVQIADFSEIARENLLPFIGAGAHVVSTSGAGLLCGLHAIIHSYNSARDLAVPEGTPLPKDRPSVDGMLKFRRTPEFWELARTYLTRNGNITLSHPDGYLYTEDELAQQVTTFIPDNPNNFEISTLHVILEHLNREYGTHYVLGNVTQGYNVRWDVKKKEWDTNFKEPTRVFDYGNGMRPVVWLYYDNAEAEELSLHQVERGTDIMGHWMGFATMSRNIDEPYIDITNSWLGSDVDDDLKAGVWIVTADIQGFPFSRENDQDPRKLTLHAGTFVRLPKEAPGEDAPAGYMWVRACPTVDGIPVPGQVGIVPLERIKKIEKNCLKIQHDMSGVAFDDISGVAFDDISNEAGAKKAEANKKAEKDSKLEFYVYRTIEPTVKTGRRYAKQNNAKKFLEGFTFENGEFLLDTREVLVDLYPRVMKIDGTSGRAKPRNLQKLEAPWRLPDDLPIEDSATETTLAATLAATSSTPGKKDLPVTDKTNPKFQYRTGMSPADFKIKDLREHCKSRGFSPNEYGKTKASMLKTLIDHDEKESALLVPDKDDKEESSKGKEKEKVDVSPKDESHRLPLRRVLADVPKQTSPHKMPPFFATEIVMEIREGDDKNPAIWVLDYEGRVGRINRDNLEPIERAWGIRLDPMRWNPILKRILKKSEVKKLSSEAADPKVPAPKPGKKAKPAPKEADKKRGASEPAGPEAKKAKPNPKKKAKSTEPSKAKGKKPAPVAANTSEKVSAIPAWARLPKKDPAKPKK